MSNDKMREEFDSWIEKQGMITMKDGETYYHHATHSAWQAWKASRAAPDVQGEPTSHEWDGQDKCRRCGDRDWYADPICTPKQTAPSAPTPAFYLGDHVRKTEGSQWKGRVVGTYSTDMTPEGYVVESDTERGSVQTCPAGELELAWEDSEADVSALAGALEELVDLMEDVRQGEYIPDSFTTQPARIALAFHRKQQEGQP